MEQEVYAVFHFSFSYYDEPIIEPEYIFFGRPTAKELEEAGYSAELLENTYCDRQRSVALIKLYKGSVEESIKAHLRIAGEVLPVGEARYSSVEQYFEEEYCPSNSSYSTFKSTLELYLLENRRV